MDQLGGKFASRPALIKDGEGFLHLFGRSVDSQLFERFQLPFAAAHKTRIRWSGWASLGGPITGPPAAMLDDESMLNLFVRGQDRQLWRLRQVAVHAEKSIVRWSEWEPLGGLLASTPRVAPAAASTSLLAAVTRSTDKAMWLRQQTSTMASGTAWAEWTSLGGVFASAPALIALDGGRLATLGRGAEQRVWLRQRFPTPQGARWTEWQDLGGVSTTTPAVERTDGGLLRVFARGADRTIAVNTEVRAGNATAWTGWRSLGGNTKMWSC